MEGKGDSVADVVVRFLVWFKPIPVLGVTGQNFFEYAT